MPSQEGSLCVAHGSRTVGKGPDISTSRPHPGNDPGAQGPWFCPSSWSLADSIHVQRDQEICRAWGRGGGPVTVEAGVT